MYTLIGYTHKVLFTLNTGHGYTHKLLFKFNSNNTVQNICNRQILYYSRSEWTVIINFDMLQQHYSKIFV